MAITETTSQTGRFGNATVNATAIAITGWTCTVRREYADSTDSNNYDTVTKQTWTSQQPGVVGADATIKGNFDISGVADTNLIWCRYSRMMVRTRWHRPESDPDDFISGNWDFSNVVLTVEIPGATMVSFSADAKSNGIPTIT